MTIDVKPAEKRRWARPPLEETGPVRTAGGLLGGAERGSNGPGKAPPAAGEDAVVAVVRMAYRVADDQLQHSVRLAERLSKAGCRAVAECADPKAVPCPETAALEGGGPLMRLMIAQCRLIESMVGVTPPPKPEVPQPPSQSSDKSAAMGTDGPPISLRRIRVFLKGDVKRPVSLLRCEVAGVARPERPVRFHNVQSSGSAPLEGSFTIADDGQAKLTITTTIDAASGRWKGAVCGEGDEQIGLIEIEL
jgi:hypothetical protein